MPSPSRSVSFVVALLTIVGFGLSPATAQASSAAAQAGDEIDRVLSLMSGSWQTTERVDAAAGAPVNVQMHVVPVSLSDVPNAVYVEIARSDRSHEPYRQIIMQVYRKTGPRGGLYLRTLEFKNTPGIRPTLVGLWAAPEIFPDLSIEGMYVTMELQLEDDGNGFSGRTLNPFPVNISNAVEITSKIMLEPGVFQSTDTGFAADGSRAWGGQAVSFERFEPDVEVSFLGEGLVAIDLVKGEGLRAANGLSVTCHYTGWLREDGENFGGVKFDSSYDRPRGAEPLTFALPGRLIEGWNRGIPGMQVGTVRRLIVPAVLAYGQVERGQIPANSELYFEITCVDIVDPDAPIDQVGPNE